MEIKISAKVFAEFVMGGPAKKSSTVRNILKPKSPEAQIPSRYYRRAIDVIRGYHDRGNDFLFVSEELKKLHHDAEMSLTLQGRTKLNKSLEAVQSYMTKFASRKWKVIPCPKIHYTSMEVRISGTPDLAVKDGDRLRLVKLGVRKEKETVDMVRLMLRVIYQGAKAKVDVSPQDITYFDAKTGEAISGNSDDKHLEATIENGCKVLQQMIQAKPA